MILIKDERRADYTVIARWLGTAWVLLVSRKDLPWMFFKQDSPDAIETFRQGCTAIRDDAKELADFDAHITPMPVGRYSLNSSNPDRVFPRKNWRSLGVKAPTSRKRTGVRAYVSRGAV